MELELRCFECQDADGAILHESSGGSRGGSVGFKYPMKMKSFCLSETKLFHFLGIFKKNEINSAKRPPKPLYK